MRKTPAFVPVLGSAYFAYLLWLQYNVRGPGLCNRHCRGTGQVPRDWTAATPTPDRPIAGACGCATSFCCACPGGFVCCPDQSCSCCGSPPPDDLCLNCQSVGGKCCMGTGGLCACANPDLPCSRYGC